MLRKSLYATGTSPEHRYDSVGIKRMTGTWFSNVTDSVVITRMQNFTSMYGVSAQERTYHMRDDPRAMCTAYRNCMTLCATQRPSAANHEELREDRHQEVRGRSVASPEERHEGDHVHER